MTKLVGWIAIACFALAFGGMVTIAANAIHAPNPVSAFLIAVVGAAASYFGPRLLGEH